MAISRGTIHHNIFEDFNSLLKSIFFKKVSQKASKISKHKTRKNISTFFSRNYSFLTPYARTSLYTVLKGLNIKPGSTILMTPINISPMLDILDELKLKPLFIDINLKDFGPDYDELEYNLKKKPACFFLTHLFGYVPEMDYITACCRKYNVPMIEDISQNIGSKFENKYLGNFGIASIYSASFTKYVDSYSGSFIITDDKSLSENINIITKEFKVPSTLRIQKIILRTLIWNLLLNRIIFSIFIYPCLLILKKIKPNIFNSLLNSPKKYSRLKLLPKYYFEDITELQCNLIDKKLKSLEEIIEIRKSIAIKIYLSIKKIAPNYFKKYIQNVYFNENKSFTFWQVVIKVKKTKEAKEILFKNKIETGITKLPILSEFYNLKLNNSSILKQEYIFIPLHAYLKFSDYEKIIKLLYLGGQLI